MRSLGVMTSRNDAEYRRSNEVIVRSDRGLEVGQVLCEASDDALSHLDNPPSGHIVRSVSDDDLDSINDLDGTRRDKIDACQKHIDALGLEMKLVDVEQLFGGERIVVFYLSEERVDFRDLVKLLASEFKTRIEMKQIGVRDEAKLLADYGDCGKPVCCNNHLVKMPPVSMKMAKLQKATLDPTKISGRCGRLKCCLRYEFDTYLEIQKQLPKIGSQVLTRNGKAKVLNHQIISEQLLVETEDHRRMVIDASEVLTVIEKSKYDAETKKADKEKSNSKQGRRNTSSRNKSAKEDNRGDASTKQDDDGKEQTGKRPGSGRRPGTKRPSRKRKQNSDGPSNESAPNGSSGNDMSSPKGSQSTGNQAKQSDGKPKPGKKRRPRRRKKKD